MATATETRKIYVTISRYSPNLEPLEIIEERPKAYRVRNTDNGTTCWLPKSGLQPRQPDGDDSYADEFTLKGWFRDKLDCWQERALGILE